MILSKIQKCFNFILSYETNDGTKRSEKAQLVRTDNNTEVLFVTGFITWFAPSGEKLTLKFVADQNGFQPETEPLPK